MWQQPLLDEHDAIGVGIESDRAEMPGAFADTDIHELKP
jgi:hypothetical protein